MGRSPRITVATLVQLSSLESLDSAYSWPTSARTLCQEYRGDVVSIAVAPPDLLMGTDR